MFVDFEFCFCKFVEMIPQGDNITLLLRQISDSNLYIQLIKQLKKDFGLVGEAIEIDEFIAPNDLIKEVYQKINHLLKYNFNSFLQLLYRVDLPETSINFSMKKSDTIAQEVTFLILKREWGKVKLRENFK